MTIARKYKFDVATELRPVSELEGDAAIIAKSKRVEKYFLYRKMNGGIDQLPQFVQRALMDARYVPTYIGLAGDGKVYVGAIPM